MTAFGVYFVQKKRIGCCINEDITFTQDNSISYIHTVTSLIVEINVVQCDFKGLCSFVGVKTYN